MNSSSSFHIEGYENELGSIFAGSCVLLSGKPGCHKSFLTLRSLYYEALTQKKNSLFVSLHDSAHQLIQQLEKNGCDMSKVRLVSIRDLKNFGIEITKAKTHPDGNILILDRQSITKEASKKTEGENRNWINVIKNVIKTSLKEIHLDIVAIDSITVLHKVSSFAQPYKEIHTFVSQLKDLGMTTILVNEELFGFPKMTFFGEETVADYIVRMKHTLYRRKNIKEIRMLKSPLVSASQDTFTLEYKDNTISAHHGGQEPIL